jgi:starvation-inducible DNA-binding protein
MFENKLKVPHALDVKKGEAIAGILNPIIASIFALYIKTKNYHWHLIGPHFRDYHLLFDEQAAQLFEMIDVLAERVRKLGQPTLTSLGQINEMKGINDDDQLGVSAEHMIRHLVKDNLALALFLRQAHEICDKNEDCATTSLLEVHLDETERRIWFLQSILNQ